MRRSLAHWRSSSVGACALVLVWSAALGAQQPSIRDSAGIEIVENAKPAWQAGKTWTLSRAPILEIGADSSASAFRFSRIAAALRLSDGRIAVAERASLELRLFDANGHHLWSVGKKGERPGEFTDLGMMMRLAGDSLAVESLRYTSVFAPDGKFVRQVRYGPFEPEMLQIPMVAVLGRFPDGSALIGDFPQGRHAVRGAGQWVDSSTLLLAESSGKVRRVVDRVPALTFGANVNAPTPLIFGAEMMHASSHTSISEAFSNQYAIRQFDAEWNLKRIIRRAWSPHAFTAAERTSYVDAWMTLWSTDQGVRRERDRLAKLNAQYPDYLPAFVDMLSSPSGVLWLRDASLSEAATCACLMAVSNVPSSWSIFDARGVWLGKMQMPPRFTPTDVGDDYVLGFVRDTKDALRVVMYRVVKPK